MSSSALSCGLVRPGQRSVGRRTAARKHRSDLTIAAVVPPPGCAGWMKGAPRRGAIYLACYLRASAAGGGGGGDSAICVMLRVGLVPALPPRSWAPSMSARAVIAVITVRWPQAAATPTLFATAKYRAVGEQADCPGSLSTADVRNLKSAVPIVSICVASGSGSREKLGREAVLSPANLEKSLRSRSNWEAAIAL